MKTNSKKSKRKVHMEYGGDALCHRFHKGKWKLTNDEAQVTCKKCLHLIGISDAK